tara:strand:+ start:513 stop:1475 length:963 start_codon:yes stop_codon:yes gene_type:complete
MLNSDSLQSSVLKASKIGTQAAVYEDGIEFRELLVLLWAEKWLIMGVTFFAAIISLVFSMLMTDIYRAESTLAPAELEKSAGTLASQLGGAASLLGVNLGAEVGDEVSIAIAILRSRKFVKRFIEEHELLIPLFAEKWNSRQRISEIDSDVYSESSEDWIRKEGKPSDQEAFAQFSNIVNIAGPARESGLVTIAIDWHNPKQASDWVNLMVTDINRDIKNRDVAEASSAIQYLQAQLQSTSLVEMQRALYQLIESQTRITMLADVREEYVFRIIDPAVIPELKVAPNIALNCVVGTLFGGFLSLIFVFIRKQFKALKKEG